MNKEKVIKIIENKEWDRLINIARFELNHKQVSLNQFWGD